MQEISLRGSELTLESAALDSIADRFGTPCYVYSKAAICEAYQAYTDALGSYPGKICYAVKANSNLAILQILAQLNAYFDIVSVGELERVIRAGGKADHVIFSGVGKTRAEMARALEFDIACFNVESAAELLQLSRVASDMGKLANVSLRVNPDVDANTHPYISTGLKENKFGIPIEDAIDIYKHAMDLPGIKVVGVDCHIGSQLTDTSPFLDALDRLLLLVDQLLEHDIVLEHIDLGGGIGVTYRDEVPPSISDYIATVINRLGGRNLELVFEPGRSIVGNAGVLLTEVIYLKPGKHKNFAIVDAAMNDNIRPSLYQAWQDIRPLKAQPDSTVMTWDIVGPVCETSDFLAKNRKLAIVPGARLALMSSGAYGFVMASNYNTRCRAPEVLVDGSKAYLIRERETFADLIRGEKLLDIGVKS